MNSLKPFFTAFMPCRLGLVFYCFALFFLGSTSASAQWIMINRGGGNPDPSAALEVQSSEHGILIPRLSQAERDAINSPAKGLLLYQTDQDSGFYFYNGSLWQQIVSSAQLTESTTDELQILNLNNDTLSISNGNSVSLGSSITPWNDSISSINTSRTVGIGTLTPDTNASLSLAQKPFIPPRLSNAQMLALPNPSNGMVVFNSSLGCPCYYFAGRWENGCGANGFENIDVNTVTGPLRGDISASAAGGTSADQGIAIAVDSIGNAYITGFFQGTATFGDTSLASSGSGDVFVSKLDPDGNFLWVTQVVGAGFESSNAIAVDKSGNTYITGNFVGTASFGTTSLTSTGNNGLQDIFVSKLDPNGSFLWATQAGGNSFERSNAIAVDNSGNIYITGNFVGTASFGSTSLTSTSDGVFVSKLDPNGNFLWARQVGGDSVDLGTAIAVDASGNAYITGLFTGTASFGSTSLESSSSGNFDVNGGDVFVSKLDPNGSFLWATQAGGSSPDQGSAIAVDNTGNVYITGFFTGTASFGTTSLTSSDGSVDVFVSKLDPNGNFLWATQAGGNSSEQGLAIAVDKTGNTYITGNFQGTATFGGDSLTSSNNSQDVFVSKLDPNGSFLWAIQAGGASTDQGFGIAVDSSGNAYTTGFFIGTATLGGNSLTSSGGSDVFMMRIDNIDP